MQNPINSVFLFVILCASAALGLHVHKRLPEKIIARPNPYR